ncbi:MAG: ornithine cyclodeaminase family protein [Myxococcales bacterium]|nr:ornithine cyclodeaminase family protein [Myxococcales bacterium]
MSTLLLTQSQIRELLDMQAVFSAVEDAFAAHGRNETLMPSKIYLSLPGKEGDFRAMPSYMHGAAGLKWVNAHPNNPQKHHLPTVMALFVLNDPDTALPLAVMDATLITAYRTGAAAGVASKYLARETATTIGFVGSGVQARFALEAHRVAASKLDIRCADLSEEAAQIFARDVDGKAVSVQEACACDIVCTTTPSRTPVVKREWLAPGCHINAMGADAPGKQELSPAILSAARVYVDDVEQASHSGEINVPLHEGTFQSKDIVATLGQVVAEKSPGRQGNEITVFDSTGLALQDLAVAKLLYERARSRNVGVEIDFLG